MKYYSYRGKISIIDRSNPHQPSVIYPKGHKEFPEGKSHTRIEEMRHYKSKHGFWFGRIDCLHMHLDIVETTIVDGKKTEKTKELFNEFLDMDDKGRLILNEKVNPSLIPKGIKDELKAVYLRIIAASKEYPEMMQYLRKSKD